MDFCFNTSLAQNYKSNSQKIRVLSECWVGDNLYCPVCGNERILRHKANTPVGDFYCENCAADFELKSKNGLVLNTIMDGAYDTMIRRITSFNNPNFLFLSYKNYEIYNLIAVPKYFFTPQIIEKRKPLLPTARRAGWVGCNINITNIPDFGKIFIIKNQDIVSKNEVVARFAKASTLKINNIKARGWLFDTLKCIEKISTNIFELGDIYKFEPELRQKHPQNNFIKDKLRQQLQFLRERGIIEFLGNGKYRKIL